MNHVQTLPLLADHELPAHNADAGCGTLSTSRGLLPLAALDVRARLCGLAAEILVQQTFVNTAPEPIEATYLFPLPDRAAVTRFELRVADRVVAGVLQERAAARAEYEQALQKGHRAAIAEENRPDVFSLRVGNLLPGERAVVTLALAGRLDYADGEATFRFPLVVAPRYIPGQPLPGESVGPGTTPDTNLVPDASLLTPPVLLPGFPNPVRLSLAAEIEPAGLAIRQIASSLHAIETVDGAGGRRTIRIEPGERLNRDFILRLSIAESAIKSSLVLSPDAEGDEGTFLLTLIPPAQPEAARPRDVVLLLDRSGSMGGWKIVAARRAAARIVDSLTAADRFAVLAFDDSVEAPPGADARGLSPASDRQRYRAVEFLARLDARGGTELAEPLARGAKLLAAADPGRDRVLVLVTDGQVGSEDHLLQTIGPAAREIRIFTLGIDQAVNAGFLRRLAALGGGACDLVESEDRLDAVLDKIHRRIAAPLLAGVTLAANGLQIDAASLAPARPSDLHAGVPLVVQGRYRGPAAGTVTVSARDGLGDPWSAELRPAKTDQRAIAPLWARGRIRDLEDQYAAGSRRGEQLERDIVATSLRFGVLSRFTAFIAVDRSEVVNAGGKNRPIVQPVELPAGWEEATRGGSGLQCFAMACAAPAAGGTMDAMMSLDDTAIDFCDSESQSAPVAPPQRMAKNARARSLKRQSGRSFFGSIFGRTEPAEPESQQPVDLTAYRRQAAEWLADLRGLGGDGPARLPRLRKLALQLAELVADLQSVGADAAVIMPLAELQADLAQLSPTSNSARVDALWRQADEVLAAFTGSTPPKPASRKRFWQPPATA